ncbi:efflux RND transporter permease subunit [Sinobaca sp. H24]|uniref:efflux RND transporter permease subunit n=1 Tax=Sinobaca sp. H24 TaxID=2923376 RepID=UPI00207A50B4|nr:efflux RND transporter permease subunit [Sinobaca sp. H24]
MIEQIIKKRKITILFFIMLCLVGGLAFLQLPQKEIPAIDPPVAQINTVYPGASAEAVESSLTNPLEESTANVQGIAEVTSVSSPGFSSITLELEEGRSDTNEIWTEIERNINEAARSFPEDAEAPSFSNSTGGQGLAIYQVVLNENAGLSEVQNYIESWERNFTQLSSITEVGVEGDLERELRFSLDPEALADDNLSAGQVIGAVSGETSTVPPGEWQIDDRNQRVELPGASTAEELEEIIVGADEEGDSLRLSDVGRVEDTLVPAVSSVSHNGEQALSLTFFLAEDASVPAAQEELDPVIEDFEAGLPEGAALEELYTQADLVSELFTDLAFSFALAFISVFLICAIGLSFSTAAAVGISIPVSLTIAAIVLPFANVGLDQISLIAFIISLGILVDDAIVVNENIDRRLKLGDSPFRAATLGVRQVAVSVIVSTLTVVFTFFPLLLLPGSAGAFIRPLPVVLIAAIIASTIVALTIMPLFRAAQEERALRRPKKRKKSSSPGLLGSWIDKGADLYSNGILKKVVKRPILFSAGGLLLGTAAYALVPFTPVEFFPDTDREEVFIEASLEEGTTLADTEEKAEEIETWLLEQEEIRSVSSYAGTEVPRIFNSGNGGGATGESDMQFLVYIDGSQAAARDVMNTWNNDWSETFSGIVSTRGSIVESGPPIGAPIAVEVSGENMDDILQTAEQIEQILAEAEGVQETEADANDNLSALSYEVDEEAAAAAGVDKEAISQELLLLGEGVPLGTLQQGSRQVDMRISYNTGGTVSEEDLESIAFSPQTEGPSAEEEPVALSELIAGEEETSFSAVPHIGTERTVTVRAYPGNENVEDIEAAVETPILEAGEEMPGVDVSIGGETSERADVFIDIGQIFILVVFLIFIVIAIPFYSLMLPLIVLSAVYLSTAGAILGLFLTQTGLGFMSMMGAVSLAGIVIRNGLVLIDFIEQRLKEGQPVEQAVQQAGRERFRPILLTSLTTAVGLLPIAFGNNPLFQPLGIAIVSGLVFSTLLTLLVVPALYMIKHKVGSRRKKKSLQTNE